eukprot:scaffold7994_cov17-Tisochrysis_lutea.AAC.1
MAAAAQARTSGHRPTVPDVRQCMIGSVNGAFEAERKFPYDQHYLPAQQRLLVVKVLLSLLACCTACNPLLAPSLSEPRASEACPYLGT